MSNEVKRYEPVIDVKTNNSEFATMEEDNYGDYVLHSDYEKLKAQLEKCESSLNKAINAADFFSRHADCNKDTWACRCEFCRDTTSTKNLREAREYFKEKEQV